MRVPGSAPAIRTAGWTPVERRTLLRAPLVDDRRAGRDRAGHLSTEAWWMCCGTAGLASRADPGRRPSSAGWLGWSRLGLPALLHVVHRLVGLSQHLARRQAGAHRRAADRRGRVEQDSGRDLDLEPGQLLGEVAREGDLVGGVGEDDELVTGSAGWPARRARPPRPGTRRRAAAAGRRRRGRSVMLTASSLSTSSITRLALRPSREQGVQLGQQPGPVEQPGERVMGAGVDQVGQPRRGRGALDQAEQHVGAVVGGDRREVGLDRRPAGRSRRPAGCRRSRRVPRRSAAVAAPRRGRRARPDA